MPNIPAKVVRLSETNRPLFAEFVTEPIPDDAAFIAVSKENGFMFLTAEEFKPFAKFGGITLPTMSFISYYTVEFEDNE